MTVTADDARIRSLRPPKLHRDPFVAHGTLVEEERRPDGNTEKALTLFATGAECPFTCSFCDLWQYSIDGPTPAGALTRQVERALAVMPTPTPDRFKFYNASNFFDVRAVPPDDAVRIAAMTRAFKAITVESHASTIGPRVVEFAQQIAGRLEVAMGLETIHPDGMAHLNKRLDLARFDRAARTLSEHGIDLRVFVLLGVPHVPAATQLEWTQRTVRFAVERGASIVSIIPVRGGNGEMERLRDAGHFTPPTLCDLEASLEMCVGSTTAVVTADLWDAERLPACGSCRHARIERMRRWNVTGVLEARVECDVCMAAA